MEFWEKGSCSLDCAGEAVGRLVRILAIAMSVGMFAFVRSTWTGVMGQTDNCWNVLPAIYSWILYFLLPTPRGLVAATCATLWSVRITYNYARKGGFVEEDYLWAHMRKWFSSRLAFICFIFWFVSVFQNLVIIGFTLPAYVATLFPQKEVGTLDWVVGGLMIGFIALEAIADQQQWNYQSAKKAAQLLTVVPVVYQRGFYREGLFRYSRHPNFFAELAIWWTFYGFSIAATGQVLHWSIVGPFVLTLIFHGSSNFTEEISASKYAEYSRYQKETSRLIPWFCRSNTKQE